MPRRSSPCCCRGEAIHIHANMSVSHIYMYGSTTSRCSQYARKILLACSPACLHIHKHARVSSRARAHTHTHEYILYPTARYRTCMYVILNFYENHHQIQSLQIIFFEDNDVLTRTLYEFYIII